MTKATILSLEQTDVAGLFTIIFEGESQSEFVKFVNKFKDDAVRKNELRVILNQIDTMLLKGIEERRFRPEGKMSDGGVKTTKTYEEDEDLNGYVISLQKLDGLLKTDIENGVVRIEKTQIVGADDKEYDI